MTAPSSIKEHALHLAKVGWTIFPAPPGEKKSHKKAEYSGGRDWGATRDPDEIRRDFERWPNANIGIPTGAINNCFVIDIDRKNGKDGFAALDALETKHGKLPDTLQVESPSGSIHYYFRWPGFPVITKASPFAAGIDVRGDGGMVIAPPSVKPDAGAYKWRNSLPIADPPQWLLDLVKAADTSERKESRAAGRGEACAKDTRKVLDWLIENNKITTDDAWREAGMALRDEFGDDPGLGLFSRICFGQTVDTKALNRWNSYVPGDGIGIGTLRKMAKDAGCPHSIGGKSAQEMFGSVLPTLAASPPIVPTSTRLIQSGAEFVANFTAPSYLLDGILQKQFCYTFTAATGGGKTAIALRLGVHVALGLKFGDRDVERGRVLFVAAENYVDVQARFIAMAQHCGFDLDNIDVYFIAGKTKLSEIADQVTIEARAIGDLALVVVDTSAATFEGADENSNVDALTHAKRIRSLTELQGNPTVLLLCHPVKSATNDNLVPRGGGALLAEIDGNLCARKGDSSIEVHWAGKFRGMDFTPMAFRLDTVTADRLKDARGRSMPTVLATPINDDARQVLAATERSDQDRVLRAIYDAPGKSYPEIAKLLGWTMGDGKPYAVKVRRAAERLAGDGLLMKERGAWVLTPRGERELNKLDAAPSRQNSRVLPMPPLPVRNP